MAAELFPATGKPSYEDYLPASPQNSKAALRGCAASTGAPTSRPTS
ncbi:hypothetical protein [Saccharothrix sp. NRRL B-16348]|nr:hypothetical protein [Saccharothrix sp. NRRL B-16348]